MSHTTTIDAVIITDVVSLKAAISDLKRAGVNCELLENAIPRAYYSDQSGMGKADFVVKLHDSKYDVGLYKNDKGYEARTDFYAGEVAKVLGVKRTGNESSEQAGLGKLYQSYAVQVATRKAIQQGYTVNRVNKNDGSVQLQITVAA